MDSQKPFAASNSVGSLSHTEMTRTNDPNSNNNSMGSRSRSSTSFKDFMRNNDPNNNNSNSTRASYKSNKPQAAAAAAASLPNDNNYMDLRSDYFRQQSGPAAEAAMFASASHSSGSDSEPSNSYHQSYKDHNPDRYHYQSSHQHAQNSYLRQPKYPPGYDSRPNLKNDQSDSYKTYLETKEASHQRDNHDMANSSNSSNDFKVQPKQQPQHLETSPRVRENPVQKHGSPNAGSNADKPTSSTNRHSGEPRPYPRAGRPPASTTVPVCPALLSRKLGRRGLLLGQTKQPQREHYSSQTRRFSGEANHDATSKRTSHDPGPMQGLSTTITVECQACGEVIKAVPKNAIALECPSCKKFYPTVTCRVLQ